MKMNDYIFVRYAKPKLRRITALKDLTQFAQTILRQPGPGPARFSIFCAVVMLAGCRTTPMRPVDLKEPGWTVHEGQAVWKRDRNATELAGEVIAATRSDGSGFVQFTKTPFPMIIAQTTPNHWQIEIPTQNRRFSGPGSPPKRLIWAYLPALILGRPAPKGWSWSWLPDNGWRLENSRTGETLQGYFSSAGK